jgi:hypothetical protein
MPRYLFQAPEEVHRMEKKNLSENDCYSNKKSYISMFQNN